MTADKSPRKDSAGRPDENFEPYELHGKMPWPLIAIAVGLGIWGAATLFDTREDVAAARDERIAESRVATGAGTEPGSALFVARCSTCHQPDGMGVRGAIPPLAGSAFVAQGPELVSTILLRGIDGPIRVGDHNFNGHMPSFASVLTDVELGELATYVAHRFGKFAGHPLQFVMVRVLAVVAGLEHDAIARRKPRQRIDMGVGIVSFKITMIEPEHAVGVQALFEHGGHLLA